MPSPLLVTLEYPPQKGGVAVYLAGEVRAYGNVEAVLAQKYFWKLWPHWLPLLWRVRPEPDQMLWVSHVLPIGYVALFHKMASKTPYRVYLHGLDLVRPLASPWKTFWIKKILTHADEVICNSKATATLLERYNLNGPGMVKGLRMQYPRVPEVDASRYEQQAQELRQKYNLNGPILLTISRLVKRKGIDVVIRALDEVWKHVPELTYIIVGDGEEREALGKLASGKRVIFVGSVSDEEKYAWLSLCNCFILTPINDPNDFEGYGIVYKEAQMFGKPVIGSRVGGVPEAVGENGTLVEAGDTEQIAEAILQKVKRPG